jgi:hypothetical protein
MADDQTKVLCETPTPGKQGTHIPKWKYDLVRTAILDATPTTADGLRFADLADEVASRLSEEDRGRLGSITWHTVCVKLDMEVKGEIERIAGVKPQRIRRKPNAAG